MIFVTVGTVLPFDRLIKAVEAAVEQGLITEPVVAQVGQGGYRPKHLEWTETMNRPLFERTVEEATAIVSHAGIGTIMDALAKNKRLLVVPRRASLGEHVNDHQVATARKFAELGHVLLAYDEREIPAKLAALESFVPVPRHADPAGVIARLRAFLDKVADGRRQIS
jgi:UDP-N-acetylglucosamine transferase subunit ALG13